MSTRATSIASEYEQWMRSWAASEATIDARVGMARNRLAAWGVHGFTPDNIQRFLATPGWSKWTRATYHNHLTSLCEFLVAGGWLTHDPMGDVRQARRPRSLPRPLSDDEMALVIEHARAHDDPRILDWITMARRAGLRCHEIAKFSGEHLTDGGLYVHGKGGREAVLPVHTEIAAMARRHPRKGHWWPSPAGGHLRPKTLSTRVSRFFDELGITGSVHRVRHCFGTDLLRAGNDLRVVQELMRHSSLATTAVYTLVDSDRMAAAIHSLPAA